jgi:hypothetical protein
VHQTQFKLDYNQATSCLNHETLIFANEKHLFRGKPSFSMVKPTILDA